jgi:hypothetical protein
LRPPAGSRPAAFHGIRQGAWNALKQINFLTDYAGSGKEGAAGWLLNGAGI